MKGKKFSDEQIVKVLKESEAGAKTADLCRKHGVGLMPQGPPAVFPATHGLS